MNDTDNRSMLGPHLGTNSSNRDVSDLMIVNTLHINMTIRCLDDMNDVASNHTISSPIDHDEYRTSLSGKSDDTVYEVSSVLGA